MRQDFFSEKPRLFQTIIPPKLKHDVRAACGAVLFEALDALPDLERNALFLHVWEGLSYEEIAASLDIPIGTVRSRLNRARQRMRELHTPGATLDE